MGGAAAPPYPSWSTCPTCQPDRGRFIPFLGSGRTLLSHKRTKRPVLANRRGGWPKKVFGVFKRAGERRERPTAVAKEQLPTKPSAGGARLRPSRVRRGLGQAAPSDRGCPSPPLGRSLAPPALSTGGIEGSFQCQCGNALGRTSAGAGPAVGRAGGRAGAALSLLGRGAGAHGAGRVGADRVPVGAQRPEEAVAHLMLPL